MVSEQPIPLSGSTYAGPLRGLMRILRPWRVSPALANARDTHFDAGHGPAKTITMMRQATLVVIAAPASHGQALRPPGLEYRIPIHLCCNTRRAAQQSA